MELLRIQLCPKRSTRASLSTCLTLGTHIASELCVSLTVKHRLNPSSELFCAQHLARTSLWSAPDPRSSSGHAPWPLPDSELVFLLLLLSTHDNNFFGKRSFPKKRFVILPKAHRPWQIPDVTFVVDWGLHFLGVIQTPCKWIKAQILAFSVSPAPHRQPQRDLERLKQLLWALVFLKCLLSCAR